MTDPALASAVAMTAEFEGFSSTPYLDIGGTYTYGFGFTYLPNGRQVTGETPPIDRATAEARLASQVARVLAMVRSMVHVPISNNQAAAMSSFAFNEGTGALHNSELLLKLNQGRITEAADCFLAWIYAGGKANNGLRNRRERERAVFLTPDEGLPPEVTNEEGDAGETTCPPDPDTQTVALLPPELHKLLTAILNKVNSMSESTTQALADLRTKIAGIAADETAALTALRALVAAQNASTAQIATLTSELQALQESGGTTVDITDILASLSSLDDTIQSGTAEATAATPTQPTVSGGTATIGGGTSTVTGGSPTVTGGAPTVAGGAPAVSSTVLG